MVAVDMVAADTVVGEVVSTVVGVAAFTAVEASTAAAAFTVEPRRSTAAVARCFTAAASVPEVPYSMAARYTPVQSSTAAALGTAAPGSRTTITGASTERPTIRMTTTLTIIRTAAVGSSGPTTAHAASVTGVTGATITTGTITATGGVITTGIIAIIGDRRDSCESKSGTPRGA